MACERRAPRHAEFYAVLVSFGIFRAGSNERIFSVLSLSSLSLSVRTFSLLGEKGEGVVFSRPLRASLSLTQCMELVALTYIPVGGLC